MDGHYPVLRYPMAGLFLLVLPLMFTAFFGILFGGINNADEQVEVPVLAAVSSEGDWTRVETCFPIFLIRRASG